MSLFKPKRLLLTLACVAILFVAATSVVNYWVEKTTADKIFESVDKVPASRVALLLGTTPHTRGGGVNAYFRARITTAASLFHSGKVDFILASGDNSTMYYNESEAMRRALVEAGVPDSLIYLDYAGFRTLDSVVRARKVFGCDEVIIVSQRSHCARAICLAEAAGLRATAVEAPTGRLARRVVIKQGLREWLARDRMALDILFNTQPHFLGPRIDIK